VEKYSFQKLRTTNFEVVQQNYNNLGTQPKVEERSNQYGKIYFLFMKDYNNGKTWVGPHLHKIGKGFVEI
jgi:hypothetical protein